MLVSMHANLRKDKSSIVIELKPYPVITITTSERISKYIFDTVSHANAYFAKHCEQTSEASLYSLEASLICRYLREYDFPAWGKHPEDYIKMAIKYDKPYLTTHTDKRKIAAASRLT